MKKDAYPQNGFALIAAILVMLVLTAVGVLVFATSTDDIRISGRLVGEKRAFSAAEAGIHSLSATFDPQTYAAQTNIPVKAGSLSRYSIALPARPTNGPSFIPYVGASMEEGKQFVLQSYTTTVTGTNTNYDSTVQIQIGVAHGPVDGSNIYR
jgi:Tfp pilus assembly protein PilX